MLVAVLGVAISYLVFVHGSSFPTVQMVANDESATWWWSFWVFAGRCLFILTLCGFAAVYLSFVAFLRVEGFVGFLVARIVTVMALAVSLFFICWNRPDA